MYNQKMFQKLKLMTIKFIFMLLAIGFVAPAYALCASPDEGGKWWNTNPLGDPISLEVSLDNCGDQVLNGQQTSTTYGLKAFVTQSGGNIYQRPKAKANLKIVKGKKWLLASVPTGGYVDRVWVRRDDLNGKERLYVYIKHESLDSKPSAESRYWFSRQRAALTNPNSNPAVDVRAAQ